MATVVNDLVTKFSFLGSVKPLGDYNVSLGGSIKLLGGMALGLNAAAGAFMFWTDGVLGGVDALSALSKESNISVAAIQELNFVAEQTQSSAGAMESTIGNLSKTIGDAAQKGSDDFARLGISVRDTNGEVKNADTILGEVGDRFKTLGLSISEQKSFASALGIDTSLLQMLGKTSAEMAAMRDRARELGTLTAEQTEQAELYKQSLNEMWFGINAVSQLVAVGFAPTMRDMAENFTDLLADNKDWIVEGIRATIEWVGNLTAAFNRLLPFFALIGAGYLVMQIAALGFGGAMALVFAPVVLITAGIVGLLLIVDDLIVAFNGGKSVIADFFAEFLGVDISPILQGMVDTLLGFGVLLLDLWTDVGDAMMAVFSGIGTLLTGDFLGAIDEIWSAFTTLGDNIYAKVFEPLFNLLGGLITNILPDWALNLLGGGIGPVTVETLPVVAQKVMTLDTPVMAVEIPPIDIPVVTVETPPIAAQDAIPTDPFATMNGVPPIATRGIIPIDTAAAGMGSVTTDNRRVDQSNEINIFTPDPLAAGRAVDESLQKQLDNANTQLDTGGR